MFACETCTVRSAIDALHPVNRQAWALFHQVCSRFLMESGAVGVVLERALAEEHPDDVLDLVARLSKLYDVYFPVKKPKGKGHA